MKFIGSDQYVATQDLMLTVLYGLVYVALVLTGAVIVFVRRDFK